MPLLRAPHALLPDPVARTGTPLSRSSSPSPTHSAPSPSPPLTLVSHHPHLAQQQPPSPCLHHPLPQPYPTHSSALAPLPTLLHAASHSSRTSQSTGPSPSPPTTPTPFTTAANANATTSSSSSAAAFADAVEVGLRVEADREGVHHRPAGVEGGGRGAVDGLAHAEGWVEGREVLAVKGGVTVRAISVDDYAQLEQHHLSLDVPETTLFPWLHGMGDGNRLLDDFFSSFPGCQNQYPAPRYRGLTVLRASGLAEGGTVAVPRARASSGPGAALGWERLGEGRADGEGEGEGEEREGGGGGGGGGRRRGGSLASSELSSVESETSWAHSEASSFPTSISSLASSAASTPGGGGANKTGGGGGLCRSAEPAPPVTPAPAVIDVSTGSVGLDPAPQAAYATSPVNDDDAADEPGGGGVRRLLPALLTSAVPAEEILTLTAHPPRRVGASSPPHLAGGTRQPLAHPAQPPQQPSTTTTPHGATDRVPADELAKVPLGRPGAVKGVFRRRDVGEGTISLRNLGVQGKKYATISDLVIYHPQGFCVAALNVAERAAEAVDAVFEQRRRMRRPGDAVEPVRYNVFLVTEPFAAFEQRHPELVAVDRLGRPRRQPDLFAIERRENAALTGAREVSPGFFMGNSADCPVLNGAAGAGDNGSTTHDDEGRPPPGENALGVDVCIEAFDEAEMPDPARLRHASQYLASLSPPASHGPSAAPSLARRDSLADAAASLQLDSPTHTPAGGLPRSAEQADSDHGHDALMSDPDDDDHHDHDDEASRSPAAFRPRPGQIYHLQCLSTSLVAPPGDWRALHALAGHVVDFVRWCKATVDDGRRVLVHGYDGYTETSIFALAYVMHAHSLLLPEAYLHLHLSAGRSFFVYPHDLPLLRRIEDRLRTDARAALATTSGATVQAQHAPAALPAGGHQQKWKSMLGGWKLGHYGGGGGHAEGAAVGPSTSQHQQQQQAELARRERDTRELERRRTHDAWFAHPCFEGSLPSRILDVLYLGNLNHASNPRMLHMLGITHVVSVGESALLDPAADHGGSHPSGSGSGSPAPNTDLWFEHQAGRIQVLDMQSICDDGVSPLRPCIALAVEWMERARRAGGRMLVHCKVGVSRSATVTIAYLMKHCGYTLIDAYMLVRARRLNVLIQPNLKFMFELQGWEVELSREKAELEHGVRMRRQANGEAVPDGPRQHGTKAMSWPIMAKEMAILNHRYLGGSLD